MSLYSFSDRHIGPGQQETAEMLKLIGVSSIDELINQTIPSDIRLSKELSIGEPVVEAPASRGVATVSFEGVVS